MWLRHEFARAIRMRTEGLVMGRKGGGVLEWFGVVEGGVVDGVEWWMGERVGVPKLQNSSAHSTSLTTPTTPLLPVWSASSSSPRVRTAAAGRGGRGRGLAFF